MSKFEKWPKGWVVGSRVHVRCSTWAKLGTIIGKGKPDGEPWVRCDDGEDWSAYDVHLQLVTHKDELEAKLSLKP